MTGIDQVDAQGDASQGWSRRRPQRDVHRVAAHVPGGSAAQGRLQPDVAAAAFDGVREAGADAPQFADHPGGQDMSSRTESVALALFGGGFSGVLMGGLSGSESASGLVGEDHRDEAGLRRRGGPGHGLEHEPPVVVAVGERA